MREEVECIERMIQDRKKSEMQKAWEEVKRLRDVAASPDPLAKARAALGSPTTEAAAPAVKRIFTEVLRAELTLRGGPKWYCQKCGEYSDGSGVGPFLTGKCTGCGEGLQCDETGCHHYQEAAPQSPPSGCLRGTMGGCPVLLDGERIVFEEAEHGRE